MDESVDLEAAEKGSEGSSWKTALDWNLTLTLKLLDVSKSAWRRYSLI